MKLNDFVNNGFKFSPQGVQINAGIEYHIWAGQNLKDPERFAPPILELARHLFDGRTKKQIREMYPVNYRQRKQTRVAGVRVSSRNDFDALLDWAASYVQDVVQIERAIKYLNKALRGAHIAFANRQLRISGENEKSCYKFHGYMP